MNPSKSDLQNKQKERRQRGEDFQAEIRSSWKDIPNCWRIRISDSSGGTRPGDELVLLTEINILAEHKRTEDDSFELSFLRSDQVTGLLAFDRVLERNLGLVFVSFHNPELERDLAYVFRLVTALRFMQIAKRQYISLSSFESNAMPCIQLPRIESIEPKYDLRRLIECFKSL